MGSHNIELGRRGEDAAAGWYETAGYRILDRNWRCPEGEIDLIVADGDTVVFVEVKARTGRRYGSGFDAVDHRKQRRLRALALRWFAHRQSGGSDDRFFPELRFDVADVDGRGHVQIRQQCF